MPDNREEVTPGPMAKSIRKAGLKKTKIKSGNDPGDLLLAKELDHLTEELVEVAEEMELESREGSTLEDIEGAKALASEVLEKYSNFLKKLDGRHKTELEQSVEPVVERIMKGLTLLKEAPE
jgi:hypothetical protein